MADLAQLFPAISRELTQTMGGSSGVLLAIFFSAAGATIAAGRNPGLAMQQGLERMQDVSGAAPGDRTMIDALAPALDALPIGLAPAARAARQGADATASRTTAQAGRASYVRSDKLAGHNDPGAEAVARVFEVIASMPVVTA